MRRFTLGEVLLEEICRVYGPQHIVVGREPGICVISINSIVNRLGLLTIE